MDHRPTTALRPAAPRTPPSKVMAVPATVRGAGAARSNTRSDQREPERRLVLTRPWLTRAGAMEEIRGKLANGAGHLSMTVIRSHAA